MIADEEGSIWERCARQLPLNSVAVLDSFQNIAIKIVTNVAQNSGEAKFRVIKLSNKTFSQFVLSVKGGIDFFHATGFITDTREGEKVIVLPLGATASETDLQVQNLLESISWLSATILSCKEMAVISDSGADSCCAQCVIQLRFATGLLVQGGFMRNDLVRAVRSFAKCFFLPNRRHDVIIMMPHSAVTISEDTMDSTLAAAELCPRATLIATTLSEEARAEVMQETRIEVKADLSEQIDKAAKAKNARMDEFKKSSEIKEKIIQDFKADRHGRK